MQDPRHTLDEVKGLYERFVGRPAPRIEPGSYFQFPPGVDPVTHTTREVEHLRQIAKRVTETPEPPWWIPAADCHATADEFVVNVEVPGMKREDIKVHVVGGECVVRGERARTAAGVTDARPLAVERPWGPFERHFPLPAGSRADRVSAKYVDGVLEIRVPVEGAASVEEKNVEVAQ